MCLPGERRKLMANAYVKVSGPVFHRQERASFS
jgi:hypothetical protein